MECSCISLYAFESWVCRHFFRAKWENISSKSTHTHNNKKISSHFSFPMALNLNRIHVRKEIHRRKKQKRKKSKRDAMSKHSQLRWLQQLKLLFYTHNNSLEYQHRISQCCWAHNIWEILLLSHSHNEISKSHWLSHRAKTPKKCM